LLADSISAISVDLTTIYARLKRSAALCLQWEPCRCAAKPFYVLWGDIKGAIPCVSAIPRIPVVSLCLPSRR